MTTVRAEWLAHLVETIECAQRLAWQLGTREGTSDEARELYGQLVAARLELNDLRDAGSSSSNKADPDWVDKLGWSSALNDEAD